MDLLFSCAGDRGAGPAVPRGTGQIRGGRGKFNSPAAGHLYAELVGECGLANGEPADEILARRVADMGRAAGLPKSLRECGVSEGILPLLAEEANQQWTARFNPRPVAEADILRIYQAAW